MRIVRRMSDPQKNTVVWVIRLLVLSAVLLGVAIELLHAAPFIGVLIGVCSLSLTAIWGCWYIPAYFRRYSVTLKGETIFIRHGVISARTSVIPLRQVLTLSVSATPLMRLFRIRFVVLGLPSHRLMLHCVRQEEIDTLIGLCSERGDAV